ncbi:hypothetical protein C8J55DRAFT_515255 [Lentinula edodes]|uniref:Uncharacterized protein n=1 Tax=Lentinula lateritia TaxID=40482 RepID=A0A9W9DN63_9AGAR|nr:hypothetical protein C8J55DRAFT_515255 [Lentinula edodes]
MQSTKLLNLFCALSALFSVVISLAVRMSHDDNSNQWFKTLEFVGKKRVQTRWLSKFEIFLTYCAGHSSFRFHLV